ncbi:hypothetical protein [Haloterrigena salifodinae]|nr:hypothetical protein [Haloterrigena salifodinae]
MTRTPTLQTAGSNRVTTTARPTARFALRRLAGRRTRRQTPARAEVNG